VRAAHGVLACERRGWRGYLAFVGPAVVASIAYMDPGNFATNIQAGAKYGYGLLWVVVLANLTAMLFQALSAKLGIVTGVNLAQMCRREFPRPVVWAMWFISEIAAMATDLAEFLGGAIGLSLLLGIPLLSGMAITGVVVCVILLCERRGFRPIELIIANLAAAIALCYLVEVFIVPVDWRAAALHSVVPHIPDGEALVLAVGIIGATVMPHAVYLHSGLTQARIPARNPAEKRQLVRISNQEVLIALAIAGLVNMAMVMMASGAFHAGHSDVSEIQTAYHTLTPLLGGLELHGGHIGGPDDHARFCWVPHPHLGAASHDHGAGVRRRRLRHRCNQGARAQPGGAQHRTAVSHDRAHHVHAACRYHGPVCQRPDDASCGRHRGDGGAAAQRPARGADLRHSDPGFAGLIGPMRMSF
jgi:hypothetical protein